MELSILGSHRKISNKTMKNPVENKNRNNKFHEFIHCIADHLIGPLDFSLSNTYISDPKREA